MKRILILIFVIGAAAGLKALADDSNQTTIVCCNAKISVKLNEPTNKIKTNEPVVVTIQIINMSTNATFIFHIGNTPSDFTWVITSPTGKDLSPKPDLLHEAISGWNPKLRPLESRESDYDLRSVCDFNELGTYKVVVQKEVFFLPPIRKKCEIVSKPLYITISK